MYSLLCNTSISIKSNVDVRMRWWKTVTTCKYWFILAIVNCSTFSLAVEMQDFSRDSLGVTTIQWLMSYSISLGGGGGEE